MSKEQIEDVIAYINKLNIDNDARFTKIENPMNKLYFEMYAIKRGLSNLYKILSEESNTDVKHALGKGYGSVMNPRLSEDELQDHSNLKKSNSNHKVVSFDDFITNRLLLSKDLKRSEERDNEMKEMTGKPEVKTENELDQERKRKTAVEAQWVDAEANYARTGFKNSGGSKKKTTRTKRRTSKRGTTKRIS